MNEEDALRNRISQLEETLDRASKKKEKLKVEQANELASTRSIVDTLRQGLEQSQNMYQRSKEDLEMEKQKLTKYKEKAKERKQKLQELEKKLAEIQAES